MIKEQLALVEHNYMISAIRLIAMLLIILCHFMQYMNLELAWWFNVGVQLFFLISGFLYGQRKIEDVIGFYKKSFLKILVPYWIFLTVIAILQYLYAPTVFSWGKTFLAFVCLEQLDGNEHLWFVQTILICYLFLPLLLQIKEQITKYPFKHALISFLFVFSMVQFIGFSFNGYYMIPNRISCFVFGIALAGYLQLKRQLKRPAIFFSFLAVLFNILRVYLLYYLGMRDNLIVSLFIKYAHGILGIALFLILYNLLKNTRDHSVLRFSDKYSYDIYLVHQGFILGPLSLMSLTQNRMLNVIIICVCIIIAGIALKLISYPVFYMLEVISCFFRKRYT